MVRSQPGERGDLWLDRRESVQGEKGRGFLTVRGGVGAEMRSS